MAKSGLGEPQIKKARKSRQAVLTVLSDNKRHRYNEIVKKTELSTATVSKVLKRLEKEEGIEKNIDIKSGEYPYPVYYKLLPNGSQSLARLRQIDFMSDDFIQTKWPENWIQEAFRENINKIYQEMFSLREKVTMSKEQRFFYQVAKEGAIKDRASEINLTVFHKGLTPFQFTQNEKMIKVTLELMVLFFTDFIQARKDEDIPIMMVLSYLPNVSRAHMKLDEAMKETIESKAFVSWAKLFKNVDVKSVSGGTKKELQKEYWQKYVKTHLSLLKHFVEKR